MPKQKLRRTWKDLPLVEVIWTDASIDPEHAGDLENPASEQSFGGLIECRDIGYLISQSRTLIKLAVSITPCDNTYRHSNTIPRNWIKQIIHLSRPEATDAQETPTSS